MAKVNKAPGTPNRNRGTTPNSVKPGANVVRDPGKGVNEIWQENFRIQQQIAKVAQETSARLNSKAKGNK